VVVQPADPLAGASGGELPVDLSDLLGGAGAVGGNGPEGP
jgi:hypothetical protein